MTYGTKRTRKVALETCPGRIISHQRVREHILATVTKEQWVGLELTKYAIWMPSSGASDPMKPFVELGKGVRYAFAYSCTPGCW